MRAISVSVGILALLATACSGVITVHKRGPAHPVVVHETRPIHPTHIGIPPGHLPPPGQCRVWIPGRPPGHQKSPGNCSRLEAAVPPGAWLVYRPSHDHRYVEVSVYDAHRPQRVVAVGIYEARSGRFVRNVR